MGTGPSDSLIAHKAINLCDDLSGSEKRVAAAIIDHFNRRTGQCDPALGSIAKLLGVHRRTVIRAVTALVKKGYLRKDRHGGFFHRNRYEPIWSRFRASEVGWNSRRQQMRRTAAVTDVSPLQGQGCHAGGDNDVTRTCSSNSFYLTSTVEASEKCLQPLPMESDRRGSAEKQNIAKPSAPVPVRMLGTQGAQQQIALNAAERRWNDALIRRYLASPDVYATVVDAIDDEIRHAATTAEFREPGAGLLLIEHRLQALLLPTNGSRA